MSELTRPQKKVVAKVGLDLNLPAKKIASILGIHRATVYRYSAEPTPEELQQFATEVETMILVKQQVVIAKLLKNVEELAEQALSIRDLAYVLDVITRHNSQSVRGSIDKDFMDGMGIKFTLIDA